LALCFTRRLEAVATTYGVGELSALTGEMGAKAERTLVFPTRTTLEQDCTSHPWRWPFWEFLRSLMRQTAAAPLSIRKGLIEVERLIRGGTVQQSAGLHPRSFRLCAGPGHVPALTFGTPNCVQLAGQCAGVGLVRPSTPSGPLALKSSAISGAMC
jgi:hypothetical protein